MIDVSVIIVNLNTRALLEASLRSLAPASETCSMEVIVIDNGSTDGSPDMVRRSFPHVLLTVNRRNEGFARPNNVGMSSAKGRYCMLLNSDAEVEPRTIRDLMGFMDSHPDAGACAPRLVYPDGRQQKSVKGFPSLLTHAFDMFFLDRLFPWSRFFGRWEQSYFDYDRTQEVDHAMAAALMVRSSMLKTVGLFDERFAIYYNDMDWSYRMNRQGWKTYYVHTARVVHHLGQTVSQVNRGFEYFEELYDNVMLFYQKHYGRNAVSLYKILLVMGFMIRSAGWSLVRLVRPTDRSRLMCAFSWRTLLFGLKFWKPLPRMSRMFP